MIFNYHFVEITSLAGFTSWGEFEDMDAMVSKLEELRLKGELLAVDHSVLMKCFTKFPIGVLKRPVLIDFPISTVAGPCNLVCRNRLRQAEAVNQVFEQDSIINNIVSCCI